MLGKRQSGLPSFNVADLSYDGDLLEEAKLNAEKIINSLSLIHISEPTRPY